jgi:hypothetical protein
LVPLHPARAEKFEHGSPACRRSVQPGQAHPMRKPHGCVLANCCATSKIVLILKTQMVRGTQQGRQKGTRHDGVTHLRPTSSNKLYWLALALESDTISRFDPLWRNHRGPLRVRGIEPRNRQMQRAPEASWVSGIRLARTLRPESKRCFDAMVAQLGRGVVPRMA